MIRVVRDGALATITLDRGGARNAIPLTGWQQLAQVGPLVEDASLVPAVDPGKVGPPDATSGSLVAVSSVGSSSRARSSSPAASASDVPDEKD